ncbi:MAG: hypothetical protein WA005_17350 [Candidatus Binataceae bacterium]
MERGGEADGTDEAHRMPAFFYRLSLRDQRCYLKSDAIGRIAIVATPAATELTCKLIRTLESGAPQTAVNREAQALVTELCRELRVPPIRVEVRGVRPHNARGELHGIFYPSRPPLIALWMRTARRRDVVRPRTFIRTLLHELCHYLDYASLGLSESFHTQGFFRRESSLVRALSAPDEKGDPPGGDARLQPSQGNLRLLHLEKPQAGAEVGDANQVDAG